ncbi:molybdate ABC transporter substrate-binding protein [Blastochloris viridis]|nr:molybdate ABC transporter substrate-binding protein [Blastochloris viridis]ALK10752.1 Molybdate-binding periplasmic protein precursor [Blastochloris viridis]CUU43414.1 Molybdate-binding periplasmic protein precursor [Blastochloris viridis]
MIVSRGLRRPSRREALIGATAALSLSMVRTGRAEARPLAVLAATSLKPTLDEIAGLHADATGTAATVSYGASDALVQQLADGAPADLLISDAHAAMDRAIRNQLIRADTRRRIVGNRLVLVAQKTSSLIEVLLGPGTRLSALVQDGRIAIGEAEMQPGGAARAALESLSLWADAEPRIVTVAGSRLAAAMVGRGEATLAVVFASDARLEPTLKVVGVFPDLSHPPIVYEAGATPSAGAAALALLDFLQAPAAQAAFEKSGFILAH